MTINKSAHGTAERGGTATDFIVNLIMNLVATVGGGSMLWVAQPSQSSYILADDGNCRPAEELP